MRIEPVSPRDRNDAVCPFLGQVVETAEHVCLATDEPGEGIRTPYVKSYCLKARHVSCRFFIRSSPAAKREARERRRTATGTVGEIGSASEPSDVPAPPLRQRWPKSESSRRSTKIEHTDDVALAPTMPARRDDGSARNNQIASTRATILNRESDASARVLPLKPVQASPGGDQSVVAAQADPPANDVAVVPTVQPPGGDREPGDPKPPISVRAVRREPAPGRNGFQKVVRMGTVPAAGDPHRVIARLAPSEDTETRETDPEDPLGGEIGNHNWAAGTNVPSGSEEAARAILRSLTVQPTASTAIVREMSAEPAPSTQQLRSTPPIVTPLLVPDAGRPDDASHVESRDTPPVAPAPVTPGRSHRTGVIWFLAGGALLVCVALLVAFHSFSGVRSHGTAAITRPIATPKLSRSTRFTASTKPTPLTMPHPATAWRFPPLHRVPDQVILSLSNSNGVPARVLVQGNGIPAVTVRVPAHGEAELDLPPGEHRAFTIRANIPILPERIVIRHGNVHPSFGVSGGGR